MDSQRKIFACLLVFISTGLFSSILVDANFDEDCKCLAKYFVKYFEDLNYWSTSPPWPKNLIEDYQKALEAYEPRNICQTLQGKEKVKAVTDLKKFEATTRKYFDKIKNISNGRLRFYNLPVAGTTAIINLCKGIKEECFHEDHTVAIPLADDLEEFFERFNNFMNEEQEKEDNKSQFAQHCKPASASNAVDPKILPDAVHSGVLSGTMEV